MDSKHDDALNQLSEVAQLREHRPTSRVPLIGRWIEALHSAWNNISARWYIAPVLRQQSEFNQLTVEHLTAVMDELDRQAEALTALQGQVVERFVAVDKDLGILRGELTRLQEWLISQDRAQTELRHDLGELALLVGQLARRQDDTAVDLNESDTTHVTDPLT